MFYWFLYDPFTMAALFIAYIVGFIAVTIIASRIAPKVASRISNRFGLYTSMTITGLAIIIGSLAAIYVIYYMLEAAGIIIGLEALLFFIILMNLATWLLSPWMINLFYGAKRDEYLQRIVDRVAHRAGLKPPRAVVVEGPPNAFAYGNILSGRYVAVTSGMLELASEEELEAVIGHELGHHKHRDNAVMLLFGIFPSIIYFLGIMLIRVGLWSGMYRLSGRRDSGGGGGLLLVLIGLFAVIVSIIVQVLVLAFSRLREYYADAHGAYVAGARNMQRALTKLYLYYESNHRVKPVVEHSKLRTLFIYALTDAVAEPLVPYTHGWRHWSGNIDHIIEKLKKQPVNPSAEIFMSHPPIPKRLRFLDRVAAGIERIH